MTRMLGVAVAAMVCATGALAQHRGIVAGSHASAPSGHHGFAPGVRRSTTVFVGNGFEHRPFRRNWGSYGWPYFADYGYDSGPYDYPAPAPESQPAPQPAPVAQTSGPIPSPILLELHGDQWVQVGNFATTSNPAQVSAPQSEAAIKELPPAVLVFRDGHSEEISSYSIIGPVIYTKADYWTSGNWTRKIQIADLDLPTTLKQNQQRGVKFDLPSSPGEVMIRP